MKKIYSLFLSLVLYLASFGQTPVPMASQPGLTYTEDFADIANWTNGFASGVGASRFGSVAVNATGTIPDGVKTTTATTSFSSGTSGGVQRGSENIVLLSTGTTDNTTSAAIDFFMDFTGISAGNLSFDWAEVNNSTGNRNGSIRVYYSTDGSNFSELTGAEVLNVTNNVSSAGTVNVSLPAAFNNSATARLRFYYYNGTGGSSGSRPKISIDNLTVTANNVAISNVSVSAGPDAAEPATNGTFNISLSAPAPAGGVTIDYTLGGTATINSDYTDPLAGSITISEGSTNGTITLNTIDDALPETPKTITITLTGATNGFTIGTGSASINLTDDDILPYIVLNDTYSQNFDSLVNTGTTIPWTDNLVLRGWYASRTAYNATNGSSNAGALYSFGETGSTERALGCVGSGSTGTVYYGARFLNNTGTAITKLKVTYTGEQWRNGGNASAQTVNFAYQTSASPITSLTAGTWTPISNLNFISPVTGTPASALNGNTNSSLISFTINGLNIPAGNELFIRWEDIDHPGSDHGLAIDDLTVEANPVDHDAPVVSSLFPSNGATDVSTNLSPSIVFNEFIEKGTGNIVVRKTSDNSIVQTLDVTSPSVTVSDNTVSFNLSGLSTNTGYYIEISGGAIKDLSENDFAGNSGSSTWSFTTGNTLYTAGFQTCSSSLTDGFTQYSVAGDIVWTCTAFGRDPNAPAGTAVFPNAVQINGFAGGTNVPNIDWLISPSFDLTGTTYPLLSFWSRTAFNGLPLQLKVSTDYVSGDPRLATWIDINGRFPSQTSNIWTLSENINLAAFKGSNVHFAFVYTSSDEDGARWTIDDVSLQNSPTPPPPSLITNTTDIQFTYVASGSNAVKTFSFTGNDLTDDITVASTGVFEISKDGISFSPSLTYSKDEANNVSKTVYVRFAPTQKNQDYTGTIAVATSDLSDTVNLKGTSIDPATTLEVVNWNLEWFGSTDPSLGPTNDDLQEQNVKTVLQNVGADIYGLVEVVDESRLAHIVSQMPGYTYVIGNYGSHVNPPDPSGGPLSEAQKLAFVYKTSMFSNVSVRPLINDQNTSSPSYNYWSSGRYPLLMTADVTLNCVTKRINFILVHAKANTSPTATSYARRQAAANELHDTIQTYFADQNVIMLGDFNDDLDQTITSGINPPITSYSSFTTDNTNFFSPTLALSLAGKKSTVSYNDVIDHVIISNDIEPYYMPSTATVLSDVSSLVNNYGSTTTDHYPVFTRYKFEAPAAPIVTTCPTVPAFCSNTDGNYTIPGFAATSVCGTVDYSYVITGATNRSGNSNDASGHFEIGTSTITWFAVDAAGDSATCQTTVIVNSSPVVTIPDAYVLSSGVLPNTVYIGYQPASSITLSPVVTDGSPDYSYSWSNGSLSLTVSVSPTSNTTYSLTVTDANGCQSIANKTISVLDVKAGKKLNKVSVCHSGHHQQTLEIAASAVADHLRHGDMLGSCETGSTTKAVSVTAYPNPSLNYFTIYFKEGNPSEKISLRIMDIFGRVIEQKNNLQTNSAIQIGKNYWPGLYFVEVIQGSDHRQLKLLKL